MDESETPWSSSPAQDSGLSSPPRKRRRTAAPSITPRRFKRFFTPTPQATTRATAAGRTLRSLAPNRLNHQRPTGASPGTKADAAESQTPVSPGALSLTPPPSQAADDGGRPAEADPVTPSKTYATPLVREVITESYPAITPSISFPIDPRSLLCHRETHMQLLERSFGGIAGPARDFGSFPRIDWQDLTDKFYSKKDDDMHVMRDPTPNSTVALCQPFSVLACHNSDVVAVGSDIGEVRLVDAASTNSSFMSDPFWSESFHENAIMDLALTEDDYTLATASGDHTAKVIDMVTKKVKKHLVFHKDSVKQVRFQPGQASSPVLATSSRDGRILIWDLRYRGGPVTKIPLYDGDEHGCVTNWMEAAHHPSTTTATPISGGQRRGARRGGRAERPEVCEPHSVTALQFLHPGREHFLVSGCGANLQLRLWDLRQVQTPTGADAPVVFRAPSARPYAYTAPPNKWKRREYGVTSLALGSNGTRLYAVGKDSVVWAYSVPNLIQGASEQYDCVPNSGDGGRNGVIAKRFGGTPTGAAIQGNRPLYGFSHQDLYVSSFFVKCAVRPARDGRAEMLAVGSSNGAAMVLPTHEAFFRDPLTGRTRQGPSGRQGESRIGEDETFERSFVGGCVGGMVEAADDYDEGAVTVRNHGTALVNGHDRKEVSGVAWTSAGKLITIGDDRVVRRWCEDLESARAERRAARGWSAGGYPQLRDEEVEEVLYDELEI